MAVDARSTNSSFGGSSVERVLEEVRQRIAAMEVDAGGDVKKSRNQDGVQSLKGCDALSRATAARGGLQRRTSFALETARCEMEGKACLCAFLGVLYKWCDRHMQLGECNSRPSGVTPVVFESNEQVPMQGARLSNVETPFGFTK